MLRNMLLFGEVGERIIGLVYARLAERYPTGTKGRDVLIRLAEEEQAHGRALRKLIDVSPAAHEGYDYGVIFEGQATFISKCIDLLSDLQVPAADQAGAVGRLIEMERSLSENLFIHLKLLVDEDHRQSVKRLAETSAVHADLLADIV